MKAQMKELRDEEKANEALTKFVKAKGLTGGFLEDFQTEFDDYME
jgi:hypothetical protein